MVGHFKKGKRFTTWIQLSFRKSDNNNYDEILTDYIGTTKQICIFARYQSKCRSLEFYWPVGNKEMNCTSEDPVNSVAALGYAEGKYVSLENLSFKQTSSLLNTCHDQTEKTFKGQKCYLIWQDPPVIYIPKHLIDKLGSKY